MSRRNLAALLGAEEVPAAQRYASLSSEQWAAVLASETFLDECDEYDGDLLAEIQELRRAGRKAAQDK